MTDQQIIERLAEFMGWVKYESNFDKLMSFSRGKMFWAELNKKGKPTDGTYISVDAWNPLKDWNQWRQIEEKVMEDDRLSCFYADRLSKRSALIALKADLPTRCKALVSVLQTENE